jgi:hypothetical protein
VFAIYSERQGIVPCEYIDLPPSSLRFEDEMLHGVKTVRRKCVFREIFELLPTQEPRNLFWVAAVVNQLFGKCHPLPTIHSQEAV